MKMTAMDAGARGWAVTHATANFWRVASWYDFDDLIQDSVLVWHRVTMEYEGYTGRVRSRPHLMALFKRAFTNHIHRLAIEANVQRVEVKADDQMKPGTIMMPDEVWEQLGHHANVGEYELAFAMMPRALRYVIQRMLTSDGRAGWRRPRNLRADGTRATLNERLCGLLGVDPDRVDVVTPLRSYLSR